MAQKHLRELLKEDQEPFLLKNYIADRQCQLKRPAPKTHLQLRKRKPVTTYPQTTTLNQFPKDFCKRACLFSLTNSPDPRKSPLFDFQSPVKSPCRSPNTICLHIPARTASLLLEAAIRIQKQSPKTKPHHPNKNNGSFGLFGSLLKRLTHRNKNRKHEITGEGVKDSISAHSNVPNSPRRDGKRHVEGIIVGVEETRSGCETGRFSCSCNRRASSTVWSESNEDKSLDLDLDTSISSNSLLSDDEDDDFEYANTVMKNKGDFASCDKHSCESPFHFVLRTSPSPGRRTPDFSSPAVSPIHHKLEDTENNDGGGGLTKFQVQQQHGKAEEEEEDKEQCSPVSVLDPPFEDDDEDDDGCDDQGEDDGFDLECSYAMVQRAKHKLLQKLRRFEKLAELDPVELEKRMLEQEQETDDDDNNEAFNHHGEDLEAEDDLELLSSDKEKNIDLFIIEELGKSGPHHVREIPRDMKRLVSDLINEEEKQHQSCHVDGEAVARKVRKRLESWNEVESNTIDMMVEQDYKSELDLWKRNQQQVGEVAVEVELTIFGLLVQELAEELVEANANFGLTVF